MANRQDHSPISSEAVPTEVELSLQQIAQLGQAGHLTAAAALCQTLLQHAPDTAQAWHLLSLIALQQGQPQDALIYSDRAIALAPDAAEFHQQAGVVHCQLGDLEAGVSCYQTALALQPQFAQARYNLALAWQKLGHWDEARHAYMLLLAQQPHHAIAHYQLANVCQQQQQLTTAIAHYQQALALQPDHPEAWYNLGVAQQSLGDFGQAIIAYQKALALKPDYSEAHNGLGSVYEKQAQAAPAIAHYQQAVTLRPDYLPALLNLANARLRLGQLSDAETLYRRAAQQDVHSIRAIEGLIRIWLRTCNWSELADATAALKRLVQTQIQQGLPPNLSPLNTLYLPFSAAEQQAVAQQYAAAIAQKMADQHRQFKDEIKNEIKDEKAEISDRASGSVKRLRLGYVSGDFRCHAVGQLILQLFEQHDRPTFEVFAYSLGPDDGSTERQTLMTSCDKFRDLRSQTPLDCARQIDRDRIDILIDLAGYTDYACPDLFALRPAPLQVSYLGYPGTSGADYIDYLITDRIVTPPDRATDITEACLYLPDSYQINNNQQPAPALDPAACSRLKAQHGLPDQAVVFCCFNKSEKIEPTMFQIWMRILHQVPHSVLWLLSDRPESNAHLSARAAAEGIDPARLIYAPRLPKAEHLARHACADLILDTLHYNAHVTASDALWAGVPLITKIGETFASRVAASLLTAVGLPDLITTSLEDYERLAVHLATHPIELQRLKDQLVRDRLHLPLFDTSRTVRHLEAGYRLIWDQHQAGQPPRSIEVPQQSQQSQQSQQPQSHIERQTTPTAGSPSIPEPQTTAPSSQASESSDAIACAADDGFLDWLSQAGGSLVITTYQAGKVILVGWNGQQVSVLLRQFDKPMGLALQHDPLIDRSRLALATRHEVTLFANASPLAYAYLEDQPGRYDALYLPRMSYYTGDLNSHDLAWGDEGLWVVNTRFSCLASLSQDYSFVPRWQPSFISELAPEDRCHLNGLAIVSGKPRYVTALGETNTAGGWRATKATGGVLIDVQTNQIVQRGLSMPHSPCWHQEQLWLLNSGTGELWRLNPDTYESEVICALPGFGRGLCLVGNYALVGLSQIREQHIFGGLPVQERFEQLICGVAVVDLQRGEAIGLMQFSSGCRELYDVEFLPGYLRPMLLNLDKDATRKAFTAPEFAYWLRPSALIQENTSRLYRK
jgi:uncharacterized protein (TIGR03032 family)